MINWIILGFFIILGLFYLRTEHVGKKFKLLSLLVLCLLFYFSAYGVMSSTGLDLTSPRGIGQAIYVYVGWIGRTANNLWGIKTDVGQIVGNAIKMNETVEKDFRGRQ